jgi:hypothetical protein
MPILIDTQGMRDSCWKINRQRWATILWHGTDSLHQVTNTGDCGALIKLCNCNRTVDRYISASLRFMCDACGIDDAITHDTFAAVNSRLQDTSQYSESASRKHEIGIPYLETECCELNYLAETEIFLFGSTR